ncbi:phage baseplate assembly protein domain-containing protein [Acinetobacter sp. CFCC 10889]|uniref:phage baseplate assembly protein domain-containing protein n=1 Tax=Acinetobacter sp. CFCC 10889 TaxID=1775557 RepID=UPI000DD047B4|nr:phage baseplate assembly protein [Acinetobacter sp. CFCC 10889]
MSMISKSLGQIRQAFLGIVARAGARAQIQGLADEVMDEMEVYQQVGFSSWIPEKSRVVILPLMGKSSRSIIIASTEAPIMITVNEGETCIYDQFGHQVLLKQDGMHLKGGDVFIDDGNLHVLNGDVIDKKGSMQAMRDAYNPHTHGNSPTPSTPME